MSNILRVGAGVFTYWSAGTTYEAPSWSLSTLTDSESLELSKGKAEFKSRRSKFKRKKGTTIEAVLNFTIEFADGDAFYAALLDSFLNNTPIDMALMWDDIATSGSEGIRLPIEVFDFPINRDLEEGVKVDIGAELTEFVKADDSLADLELYTVP